MQSSAPATPPPRHARSVTRPNTTSKRRGSPERFTCGPCGQWSATMSDLEEHTLDDNFAAVCERCGAPLTEAEIHDAREFGRPFLCAVHADEQLPAGGQAVEEDVGD